MEKMTRQEAIGAFGDELVEALGRMDCHPEEDLVDVGLVKWTTSALEAADGRLVCAVYYQSEDDSRNKEADELDWTIDHYEAYVV